ncbi:PIN2/TERF1-interacting telomerase inhibitor 1 [Cichlidogyrus casuarinus]|uniref:PIN2/TERF1-interacting telomerase inhibitor 1 n=1 Tax=Cichlidogyrus casuarinus TaxID=1844966 RepID=A0ABD2PTI2_9PLAT
MRHRPNLGLLPTGNSIIGDTANVGNQLLSKMGYTAGTGLGKKRDGRVEPVKPKRNFGTLGLGGTHASAESGSKQLDDYATLLKSLKPTGNLVKREKCEEYSLEQKSEDSKSRLHYGKFTRAKDVSKYDAKALAIITGGNVLIKSEEISLHSPESSNEPVKEEFGIKTIETKQSASDYFKSKKIDWAALGLAKKTDQNPDDTEILTDFSNASQGDSKECKTSKKKKKLEDNTEIASDSSEVFQDHSKEWKTSRKKRKLKGDEVELVKVTEEQNDQREWRTASENLEAQAVTVEVHHELDKNRPCKFPVST